MKVRELLTDSSKWTKHHFAKKADGRILLCDDDWSNAACFCLAGAVAYCYKVDVTTADWYYNHPVMKKVYDYINQTTDFCGIATWNDTPGRSFEDVRKLVEHLDI